MVWSRPSVTIRSKCATICGMTTTVVHVVRHGEVHNPDHVLYGRLPDFHLSARGHEMAELTTQYFAQNNRPITQLVSSPLERAQETIAPMAKHFELPVTIDDRVLEAGNDFEGTHVTTELKRPANWWKLRNPAQPSWGEPFADIARRMAAAVRSAKAAAEGSEAIIVSHQLPIWVLYLTLSGQSFVHDPRKRRCNLASVTSVHFVDDDVIGTTYVEPARSLYPTA